VKKLWPMTVAAALLLLIAAWPAGAQPPAVDTPLTVRAVAGPHQSTSPGRQIFQPLIIRLANPGAPTSTPTVTSTATRTATATATPSATPTATPTTPAGWEILVNEGFEGDFPGWWQVYDAGASGGEYYWEKRACRPFAGGYSGWVVGGGLDGANLACGSNYPSNVEAWMIFGPFSLEGATAAELRYKLWLNTEEGPDRLCRLASTDGLNFAGTCTSGNTAGWTDRVLNLANVPGLGNLLGQAEVWIALEFTTDSVNTKPEGGYVDDVVLRVCPGGTCPTLAAAQAPSDTAIEAPIMARRP